MPKKRNNNLYEIRTCAHPNCSNTFEVNKRYTKSYCSKKCSNTSPAEISKKNNSMKNTVETKYGGIHYTNNPDVKEKYKQTMIDRYGVDCPFHSPEIVSRINDTMMSRYNDLNYSNPKKTMETKLKKYGSHGYNNFMARRLKKYEQVLNWKHITPLFDKDFFEKNGVTKKINYKFKCVNCGYIVSARLDNGYIPHCKLCSLSGNQTSKQEDEICNYLTSIGISFEQNNRTILNGFEIDILLPEHNFGIEFNGIYWHSNLFKNEKYHLNKTKKCAMQGIQLLHIFDYQWTLKQDIIKSVLSSKLNKNNKIYARNCSIGLVAPKDKKEFLDKTHIQGNCNTSVNIGLYYNSELKSLLCLNKSRFDKKYDWEISRYSSDLFTTVVGGFSKMLKYFINNHAPKNIISYADRCFSTGNLYTKNNFKLVDVTKPNYYYFKDKFNIYSRQVFQKHKLKNKLESFNPLLTETENMYNNGYLRFWDCGNYKFLLTIS